MKMSKLTISILCLIFIIFCSCSNKKMDYLVSNRTYINPPRPYYGKNRVMYIDELIENIKDSIFLNQFYWNSESKKSLKYFEYIDVVEESYRLKIYSNKANSGFRMINTQISRMYKRKGINNNVTLLYFMNDKRVNSKNDVFRLASLDVEEIKDIECEFSVNLDSCMVNIKW